MRAFHRILLAAALFFGLTIVTPVMPKVSAATAYLQCVYSPSYSARTTYGGSICFRHNTGAPVSFRTRINCQYANEIGVYYHYNVWGPWVSADSGTYSWAYCQNHHLFPDNYHPLGPDIVIHSQVEYSPYDSVAFVNGGF